ncbi:MAG: hypothetical protein IJI23_00130 [Lachnospiraceae bacterium]|nr:hypothetical protein [Lachnospiraceae bacterium]
MDEFVSKAVHEEFAKRIDEENERQNKRISLLEKGQTQINELVSSVKVLAVNMDNMAKEQGNMSARLKEIEGKPAKKWDTFIACVITAVVSFVVSYILTKVLI